MLQRVVALGASNLTRGLQTVVALSRREHADVQVLAALGHGRSYGMRSRFLFRALPSILECGLWDALAAAPRVPTRALVTDVGNDILYGAEVPQILGWVRTVLERLQGVGAETVVTGLPLASLRRLGPVRYTAFRSVLVPSCRLSLPTVAARAEALQEGLVALAAGHACRFVELPGEWYGLDPIHVRPALWSTAWQQILVDSGNGPAPRTALGEWARLYAAAPARQWIAGRERRAGQPALHVGTTPVSLY
jgi:hypothetical protein